MAHVTKFYPANSVVEKAIIIAGNSRELIFKLQSASSRTITRQTFQGWRKRHAFPVDWILPVHAVTNIPIDELVQSSTNSTQNNKNDTPS